MRAEKIFLLGMFLLTYFVLLAPSMVLATITISSAGLQGTHFNKDKVYEQEQVVLTVPVASDNDVTSVIFQIKNTTLDLVNSSYKNYTATIAGAATNGNWIYFFTLGPGIYQLSKVIATDNTSFIQSKDFEDTTIAFKVLSSSTTSTTTTTAANATTTTTAATTQTTTTISTSVTTSTTMTSAPSTIFEKLFSNPIYIIAIALAVVVPLILLVIILTKKPEVISVPESQS